MAQTSEWLRTVMVQSNSLTTAILCKRFLVTISPKRQTAETSSFSFLKSLSDLAQGSGEVVWSAIQTAIADTLDGTVRFYVP